MNVSGEEEEEEAALNESWILQDRPAPPEPLTHKSDTHTHTHTHTLSSVWLQAFVSDNKTL